LKRNSIICLGKQTFLDFSFDINFLRYRSKLKIVLRFLSKTKLRLCLFIFPFTLKGFYVFVPRTSEELFLDVEKIKRFCSWTDLK